ncbi:MAG: hypothetical protein GY801_40880 [bacterium]|nr:hypothetical protein [bacterium]
MNSDFSLIVSWYGLFFALGWLSFPLVYSLFKHFPDRGFALSKISGLFLTSYCVWLLGSIGVAEYRRSTIFAVLVVYAVLNLFLFLRQIREILSCISSNFKLLLAEEFIFLIFFLIFTLIRMYNPDISGAEKEADFTILNAILHSDSFPPKDSWFAGAHINYYYFGYLLWATVLKLSDIPSSSGFNLALATIAALSALSVFGLVYHLTRKILPSLFSSGLLMVLGNLDGFVQLLERQGQLLPFDWWRSSRVIPDTINEFPYFSFLLGDLHAHFMAIPLTLLLLSLLAQLTASARQSSKVYTELLFCLAALCLGGVAVSNGWDYPGLLILSCLSLLTVMLMSRPETKLSWGKKSAFLLVSWVAMLLLSRVFFLPFYQHFVPQAGLRNLRFVSFTQRTETRYFLIIYGVFLWSLLPFFFNTIDAFSSLRRASREQLLLWGNCALLGLVLCYFYSSETVWLAAAGLCLVCLTAWFRAVAASSDEAFSSLLLFLAFGIIAGCELVYIKDFYSHPLERQNTIFKFHYQAWILLSVGTPVVLSFALRERVQGWRRAVRWGWKSGLIVLCGLCALYPLSATWEKSNHFRGHRQGGLLYIPGLNGMHYIAYREPYEYEALNWIRQHVQSQAVILEATGKPYSFFGRVATNTGRSTVLGWGNHEALWRDQSWKSILDRTEDIRKMYETSDKTQILNLLQKYHIDYIYVGTLEKSEYQSEGLEAFRQFFPVVYKNAAVTIYAVSAADSG